MIVLPTFVVGNGNSKITSNEGSFRELNDCFHDIREPPTMNTIDSRYNNVTRIYRCIYNTIDTITDFRDNLMPQKLSEW